MTCETCKFFNRSRFNKNTGQCQRYPQAIPKQDNEWCGEYQKKG